MSKRSTTILEDIQDTYISKSDPNTSFYSSAVLNLGDNYTTLFDLPISFISKSSKIHSSTLNLHVNSCTSIIGGSVYLISPSDVLIEQATWNSKRDGANWQIAGGDFKDRKSTRLNSSHDSISYAV